MILTLILTYMAGMMSVLAPCILPFLPVIVGGSVVGDARSKWRPYIVTASLVVSLVVCTILLKASTALIGVDPRVWSVGSGVLVVLLGVFMLFPGLWVRVVGALGLEHRAQGLLGKASGHGGGTTSAVLVGAALGPVFSSCSPTYAWILATVLPVSVSLSVVYIAMYCLGVASSLLGVALLGRSLLRRIAWASNPSGWFQRTIATLFIVVGVFVATGWDKTVQTYFVQQDFLNVKALERLVVPAE